MRTIEEAKEFIEHDIRTIYHKICHHTNYPRIEYVRAFSWFGSTNQDLWRIKLSEPFVVANKDDDYVLQQLARHEVCHLFIFDHSAAFKKLCTSVGCELSGTNFHTDYVHPEERYIGACLCGYKHMRMRIPKEQRTCLICGDKIIFKPNPLYNQF